MSRHLDETQINDLVDDLLPGPARRQADAHVAACAQCCESVQRIRALRADLALLPRDIAPPARVLAGVRAQVAEADNPVQSAAVRAAGWYARPSVLAAAAVLLVALSSAATASWLRLTSDPAVTGAAAGADVPPLTATRGPATGLVAVHAMEKSYEDAIAEVQRALGEQQSDLSPETLRILQANIDIIDRALGEARAALHADPANGALAEMLRSGYERKLDVLRSASSHTRARS